MPLYEYKCEKCDYRFERIQGFNDAPIVSCPRCRGRVNRVFHPTTSIFKGSGFYSTDRREEGKKK